MLFSNEADVKTSKHKHWQHSTKLWRKKIHVPTQLKIYISKMLEIQQKDLWHQCEILYNMKKTCEHNKKNIKKKNTLKKRMQNIVK